MKQNSENKSGVALASLAGIAAVTGMEMAEKPSQETDQPHGGNVELFSPKEPRPEPLQEPLLEQSKEQQSLDAIDNDTLLKLLRQMLLIRRLEEKAAESYSLGKIGGFCHLYIGQEAVAVGSIGALRPDDYVLTSYRDHGQAIAKGVPASRVMAELFGKASGCSAGKGGSMHLFEKSLNFFGGHAIVGGQIPLATGVAFASKYKGTDQVTLCFFGEAAVNQGAFHESLNMAQLWKLPCIYICENNQYGMGTIQERAMPIHDISKKGPAYDIATEWVDGMDVLAIRSATERAIDRARKEYLPTFLEVRTYRFMGHSM
ncbi:MAG: thiamine pyrophosphate-dependent enzyme, partial [Pyrinomonadaceae bacterium]